MTVKDRPLAETTQRANEVLCRELGAADALRLVNQFTIGHGDYVSERDALFAGDTLAQINSEIKAAQPADGQADREAEA